MYVCTVSNFRH